MHLFLAAAFIFSILSLILLFRINDSIIRRKKIPRDKRYKFIKNRLFINMIISCIVFVFILWVVPSLVWHLGAKETCNIEKIEVYRKIYALSENDSSVYVGLTTVNGKQKYVFNYVRQLDSKPEIADFNKVEVIAITASEDPKDPKEPTYEKIVGYKRTRLKDNGILTDSVNAMYVDIDSIKDIKKSTKDWKETIINEKIKLFIPNDSIKKDYKLK